LLLKYYRRPSESRAVDRQHEFISIAFVSSELLAGDLPGRAIALRLPNLIILILCSRTLQQTPTTRRVHIKANDMAYKLCTYYYTAVVHDDNIHTYYYCCCCMCATRRVGILPIHVVYPWRRVGIYSMLIKGHRRVGLFVRFIISIIIVVIVLCFCIIHILFTCYPPTPTINRCTLAMSKHGPVTTFFCPVYSLPESVSKN
jgi:hypothetical protein